MCFEKVLFVGPDYKGHNGGIGAVLSVYAKQIKPFKFIASYKGGKSVLINLFIFCGAILRLLWVLTFDRRVQILHIHGASFGSFYRKFVLFILAKRLFGKKVVYHVHGAVYHQFYKEANWLTRKLIARMINQVDMVVCLSSSWLVFFKEQFEPKMVFIVNNPIELITDVKGSDLSESDSKLIKKEGLADPVRFLFLGRIGSRKGIFDLLEVIARGKSAYEGKLKLIIGGDGQTQRLRNFIEQRQLESLVTYAGWVTGGHKEALLRSANVYVLPSYNEGLPISVLEAMNYGLPVISTHVGGIADVISNGINGFVNLPGDLSALEASINHFLISPGSIEKMGAASRSFVRKFDIQEVMLNLGFLYLNLIK